MREHFVDKRINQLIVNSTYYNAITTINCDKRFTYYRLVIVIPIVAGSFALYKCSGGNFVLYMSWFVMK